MALHAQLGKGAAPDEPLLTLAKVRALKADYEADVRLLAELPSRIDEKKRRLEAAMLFVPPGVDLDAPLAALPSSELTEEQEKLTEGAQATGDACCLADASQVQVSETLRDVVISDEPPRLVTEDQLRVEGEQTPLIPAERLSLPTNSEQSVSWVSEVSRVLKEAGRGMSHEELRQLLKLTSLGQREPSQGHKGFYNAISRLSARGEVVKAGGLLYHRVVADAIEASGKTLFDEAAVIKQPGKSAALVIEALSKHPQGLSGPELKQVVAAMPEASKSMREHSQYIYNILGPLMGAGTVTRQDGIYRLATPVTEERSD